MNKLYLSYWALLPAAAFITSLVSLKSSTLAFRLISFILLLTALNEGLFVPGFKGLYGLSANSLYNVFGLVDTTVWCTVFYLLFRPGRQMYFALTGFSVVLGYTLYELLVTSGWHQLHTSSFRVYNILILLFCSLYFYEKFRLAHYEIASDPYFWMCAAAFLYHSVLFVSFTTVATAGYWKLRNATLYFFILQITGNVLYYLLLAYAYIVCFNNYRPVTRNQNVNPQ